MTPEESLALNFRENLDLPEPAIQWLLGLWGLAQTFDDFADGDEVDRGALDNAIWACMVQMPSNAFYAQHQTWLIPAVAQMALKWMASDVAERKGIADERSYMWRAGYYDVVCLVTSLCHGPSSERAYDALALYGERCEEYMREFNNA